MKRSISVGAIALAMIALVARSDKAQSPPSNSSANSAPQGLTIPSGQKFILQLETDLHTRTTRVGDRVEFSTAADVVVDNQTAIPNKSLVHGTVTKSKRAGRLGGKAEIQLRFDEIRLADSSVAPMHATITRVGYDPVSPNPGGDPKIKGDAGPGGNVGAVIAGGAQGAIIGVLTAGAKGAIYGGAAGAAITAAGMIFKRGPDLDLPRSTMFEATFDQPLESPCGCVAASRPGSAAGSWTGSAKGVSGNPNHGSRHGGAWFATATQTGAERPRPYAAGRESARRKARGEPAGRVASFDARTGARRTARGGHKRAQSQRQGPHGGSGRRGKRPGRPHD